MGQKQTFALQKAMSALPPIADICCVPGPVCYGPIADIALFIALSAATAPAIADKLVSLSDSQFRAMPLFTRSLAQMSKLVWQLLMHGAWLFCAIFTAGIGVKSAAIPTVVEEIRIVAAILSFIWTPLWSGQQIEVPLSALVFAPTPTWRFSCKPTHAHEHQRQSRNVD